MFLRQVLLRPAPDIRESKRSGRQGVVTAGFMMFQRKGEFYE